MTKFKKMFIRLDPVLHDAVSGRARDRGLSLVDHFRDLLVMDVNLSNFARQACAAMGPQDVAILERKPFVPWAFTIDAKAS